MSIELIFILILCGILTNLMSAIFGIGGGVLMVPILYTLFPQYPLQIISATSLTIVIGSSIINLIYFYKQKINLSFSAILFWSLSMIIGIKLGFKISFYLTDTLIIMIFVITLITLAIKTILNKPQTKNKKNATYDKIKGTFLCLLGGTIAGTTGIGGGSLLSPLIGQLYSVKSEQIAPYTNYMMIIGGIGNFYSYLSRTPSFHIKANWQIGYIDFSIVIIVIISSFITSFFSMKIRNILKPNLIKNLLGLILFFIAIYTLIIYLIK